MNYLARKTGLNPVPKSKIEKGYEFEPDKFGISGLTPIPSEIVGAPRVLERPVQLEARVKEIHGLADQDPAQRGRIVVIEVRIVRV